MYNKIQLNNKLKLVTHQMPDMQSVALGIWVSVGARFETKENKGIAHFLEHLLFKGSKRFSCRKLKESIEGVGGSLNGFTSEEFCCYLTKLPGKYLPMALDVLSDMVLNPLLSETEIKKEKSVVIEEIKMYRDLPQHYVHHLLDELLWPAHPLGMGILGTVESISGMTRKDISLFKEKYYTSPNIVIASCGNLDAGEILGKIDKIFPVHKTNAKGRFLNVKVRQTKARLKILNKNTEQTHLALGFHGLQRNDPNRYVLALLHVILGANMSSRLFDEVREKRGLAYEIGTQVKYLSDTGTFIVHAGIDNKKVKSCVEVVLKELEKIKQELVSEREFRRAKEFYIGQLSMSLEDTLDHMLWLGESTITLDKVYTLDEVINEIDKINLQDLKELARVIFRRENRNLALIGPLEGEESRIYEYLNNN